jgi:hypothetical protein
VKHEELDTKSTEDLVQIGDGSSGDKLEAVNDTSDSSGFNTAVPTTE